MATNPELFQNFIIGNRCVSIVFYNLLATLPTEDLLDSGLTSNSSALCLQRAHLFCRSLGSEPQLMECSRPRICSILVQHKSPSDLGPGSLLSSIQNRIIFFPCFSYSPSNLLKPPKCELRLEHHGSKLKLTSLTVQHATAKPSLSP
jgi:hypothetical protein